MFRVTHFTRIQSVQNVFRLLEHRRNKALNQCCWCFFAEVQALLNVHVVMLRTIQNITCSLHCCITGTEFFSVTGNYAGGLKAFNVVFEHDFKVFC